MLMELGGLGSNKRVRMWKEGGEKGVRIVPGGLRRTSLRHPFCASSLRRVSLWPLPPFSRTRRGCSSPGKLAGWGVHPRACISRWLPGGIIIRIVKHRFEYKRVNVHSRKGIMATSPVSWESPFHLGMIITFSGCVDVWSWLVSSETTLERSRFR
jgi:hypothetical protein